MGESKRKQQAKKDGDAASLRWISLRNEERGIALSILRDCAAEGREEKRHLWKAIAALDFSEAQKEAVDDLTWDSQMAWSQIKIAEGSDSEIEHRTMHRELLKQQKKWKREEELICLTTETIKMIVEQILGYKKLAGGGAELLVPWCDLLEEKAKAPEGDPCRVPPDGFFKDKEGKAE